MEIKTVTTQHVPNGKNIVTKNVFDLPSFDLECQCHNQSMEFAQEIKDPDWGPQVLYIEVWENDAGRYDDGLWHIFKERIKMAFLILFKGRYRTDYLSISQKQAEELKNYLSSLEW
jgi:hypothetical protein